MIKQFILGAILACQSSAFAQETDRNDLERRSCADFDYQPNLCDRQPNCQFDYRANICDERRGGGGGGGGNRACSAYDFDPQTCNRMPGCEYDLAYRACVDEYDRPDPRPNPRQQCWQFDRNPRQCNSVRGCFYDVRSAQCLDDDFGPGPGPGPGPGRDMWECSASDDGWEEHRGGHTSQAYGRRQAENAALNLCERYHGRCVITSCRQR